jgi:nucleotide-binding universal stress UspA family protein
MALARAYESKLMICYCERSKGVGAVAVAPGAGVGQLSMTRNADQLFERTLLNSLAPITLGEVEWEGYCIEGDDVGEAITKTAADHGADLIVMRSRRRPHRAALLGSIAESVCRTAPCPVLVTHSDEREWVDVSMRQIELRKILVPYDFSDYSELALKYALSLAQEYQAELHILHVLPRQSSSGPELAWYPSSDESAYHKAARRLQRVVPSEVFLWCDVKNAVSEGRPYHEILNYAEKNETDLISIGAHGAGFGMRALFGSNVDRVLRQAPCPVLVARPLKPALRNS